MFARLARPARRFATVAEPRISEAGKAILESEAAQAKAADANGNLWIKITWFVGLPALALTTVNAYMLFKEHQEHLKHTELKFTPYPYLHVRAKRFFWGDGTKTAFHNPAVNAMPDQE
ncbi:Cytochrome c oxidase subunit 6A1, mitochondrial [Blastocladiella emersonii ATCC 22665]|nr:Cytochrome c oxidase subunit 6A1, mitochondrial [Blastocladiella emersonii ATCC 22665]